MAASRNDVSQIKAPVVASAAVQTPLRRALQGARVHHSNQGFTNRSHSPFPTQPANAPLLYRAKPRQPLSSVLQSRRSRLDRKRSMANDDGFFHRHHSEVERFGIDALRVTRCPFTLSCTAMASLPSSANQRYFHRCKCLPATIPNQQSSNSRPGRKPNWSRISSARRTLRSAEKLADEQDYTLRFQYNSSPVLSKPIFV